MLLDTLSCGGCQVCVIVCPYDIWEMGTDANKSVKINQNNIGKCTLDNACIDSCPTGSIEIIPTDF